MNIRHRLFLLTTAVLLAVATLTQPNGIGPTKDFSNLSRVSQNSMARAFIT